MIVTQIIAAGDDLDSTLLHAAQGEQTVCDGLQTVGPAANHDDLQAQIVADVEVHRSAHLFAERVPSALANHGIEIAQRRPFKGNTESNQSVFHRG